MNPIPLVCALLIAVATACRSSDKAALDPDIAAEGGYEVKPGTRIFMIGSAPVEAADRTDNEVPHEPFHELVAAGRWRHLEKKSRSVLSTKPGDRDAMLHLATALMMQQRYDLAGFYAKRALRSVSKGNKGSKDAETSDLQNLRAVALMSSLVPTPENRRLAVALLSECFNGPSASFACGLNLGALQLEGGRAADASKVFLKLSKQCNGCAAAQEGIASCYIRVGQYGKAAPILKELVAMHPERGDLTLALAGILKDGLHQPGDAKDYVKAALATLPLEDKNLRPVAEQMLLELE